MQQRCLTRRLPRQERGVATLLVVMALFFLVSMVAAYTSRSLIFEQRTSANQYRATQAFEAAEGGVEWALAHLNGSRVDDACQDTADPAAGSFRSRYLVFDPERGTMSPLRWISATLGPQSLSPGCTRSAAGWQCNCPVNSATVLPQGDGTTVQPAFRMVFEGTSTPGLMRIVSTGCTAANDDCLRLGQGDATVAAARINVTVAMAPALAALPAAALTARGQVSVASTAIAINEDANTQGLAVHAGGAVSGVDSVSLAGSPTVSASGSPSGSPSSNTVVSGDAALSGLSADRFFASFFGVSRAAYTRQPAVATFSCAGGCGDRLRAFIQANPGRPVYISDALVIDSAGDIGSAAAPVLLVVNGAAQWASGGAQLYGVLYAQGASAASASASWLQGALISEADISAPALPNLRYDAAILQRIRSQQGSFVRLPGGWKDF